MNSDLFSSFFALFADILEYPTSELTGHLQASIDAMRSQFPEIANSLVEFQQYTQAYNLAQLEEIYTSTFDMQAICYPYIGYHLFGESYKRGAFMAKLVEGFNTFGFASGKELPDHISVILRFMALGVEARNSAFGSALLIEGLHPALEKMVIVFKNQSGNPYSIAFKALSLFLFEVNEKEMAHA